VAGRSKVSGELSRNFHHGIGIAVKEVTRWRVSEGISAVHNGSDDMEEVFMRFRSSFKHMAVSEAVRRYAEEKVGIEVAKFVSKPIEVQLVFLVDRLDHRVNLHLVAGDGFNVEVHHVDKDMYAAVDKMVDKLAVQLKKHKDKLKSHKGEGLRGASRRSHLELLETPDALDASEVIAYEQARRRAGGVSLRVVGARETTR
jgi:putative sigma-54 modulation protein